MSWTQTVRTAWSAVRSHTLRSALTVLGILIGIAAVILTVGLGVGSQREVDAQIDALGSNLLVVTPGSTTSPSGVRGGFGSATTLTRADAEALTSDVAVPDVAAVAAEKSSSAELSAGDTTWTTTVTGTTAAWLDVRSRQLADGRFLTAADDIDRATVVVLGSDSATELFGTTRVVGQQVTVAGVPCSVVGVLTSVGTSGSTNLDDMALVPASTMAETVTGGTTAQSVSRIYVQAVSGDRLSAASQEVTALLSNLHQITDPDARDFTVSASESLVDAAASVSRTLTVLLTGIAALSLLVGGIGVMNIMIVSVTERTREIGLRKALGATPRTIRRQFLVEASVLGLTGGLTGAVLGVVGTRVVSSLAATTVVVSVPAVVGAVVVAVAIGLVFGVYPATRAARLAPIDALRSA
ncbi:MAG: ABC transporter permease [Micrococcales bacterium]|nr:ABC transporter permease [Micrococcales bacterium]